MKTNSELQNDVQNAIKWKPMMYTSEVTVTAKDGIVTLAGKVDSYAKKLEAEDAAKNVAGVNVVVEKITVENIKHDAISDAEIAKEIVNAYKWNFQIPKDVVKVKVEKGWVTLDGTVNYYYQCETAQTAVRYLNGVKGVTNNILVKSESNNTVKQEDIEDAMDLNWSLNTDDITVKVEGKRVTLTGTVNSWYQKEEAGRIAWNAMGIEMVVNNLVVEYDYALVD